MLTVKLACSHAVDWFWRAYDVYSQLWICRWGRNVKKFIHIHMDKAKDSFAPPKQICVETTRL